MLLLFFVFACSVSLSKKNKIVWEAIKIVECAEHGKLNKIHIHEYMSMNKMYRQFSSGENCRKEQWKCVLARDKWDNVIQGQGRCSDGAETVIYGPVICVT